MPRPKTVDALAQALAARADDSAQGERGASISNALLVVENRRADVLALILAGVDRREIARRMGVSVAQVDEDYRTGLQEARQRRMALSDVLLDDQLLRLDRVAQAMEGPMAGGDPKAAAQVLEALDQRARLLNLYPAPEKIGAGQQTAVTISWNVSLPALNSSGADAKQGEVIEGNAVELLPNPIFADDDDHERGID